MRDGGLAMGKGKTKYVSVRIPKDLRDRLKAYAKREDKVAQRVVVRAIGEFLIRNEGVRA